MSNIQQQHSIQRVGLIGTGAMGAPMAQNLIKAGFQVVVYNRTRHKCDPLVKSGAIRAESVVELARQSEAVILMLANDAAVESVTLSLDGLAGAGIKDLIVVDSSTIHPRTTHRIAKELAAKDIVYLDAPVTGSRPQAESGELFFLVAGSRSAFSQCEPLFEAMGRRSIYLGASGSGSCAKLLNNMLGLVNLAALSEALTLAERQGLDAKMALDVINDSGGRSAVSMSKGPKMLARDWSSDFALGLAAKDVRLVKQLADAYKNPSPVLSAAVKVYDSAVELLGPGDDVCGLVRWHEIERADSLS